MEYIVTGNEMKLLDDTTSQVFLVPSVVLMEQAAAGVVRELVACFDKSNEFALICGRGNNAGDGIAIARLLNQAGYRCMVYYAFGTDAAGSELFELQKNIYARYGFPVTTDIECICKSDVIIDSLFGTGLKRAIEGSLADVISAVNRANAYRVAVDVPSGVDSDKGHVMGSAFKADVTYTFSYKKTGLLLWPGCDYCGSKLAEEWPEGIIEAPIAKDVFRPNRRVVALGGQRAVTHFQVLKDGQSFTLLSLWLETGRTHQIRVHLAHSGYPVVGDKMYGRADKSLSRQALHAAALEFIHPLTGEKLKLRAKRPEDFQHLIDNI